MRTLVIIPAYNEAENLPHVIKNIKYDFIIINDGSTDNTASLPYPMINLSSNHGVGYAMKVGYKYAYNHGYDYAIQIDGDCQHNPKYIPSFIKAMKKADMAIGSRYGKNVENSFMRTIGIKIIRQRIYKYTGRFISDPTSGMRMVNRKIMKYFIINYPTIAAEPISLCKILGKGKKVKEIRVRMNPRANGESFVNIKSAIQYMLSFWKRVGL